MLTKEPLRYLCCEIETRRPTFEIYKLRGRRKKTRDFRLVRQMEQDQCH
jgi:hypothetical protein